VFEAVYSQISLHAKTVQPTYRPPFATLIPCTLSSPDFGKMFRMKSASGYLSFPVASLNFRWPFTKKMFSVLHPDDIAPAILRRIQKHSPEEAAFVDLALVQSLKSFSCSLAAAFSQQLLRTWTNAWCTSSRLHEASALPCLFGCVGFPDDIKHYLRCPILWRVISSCDRLPILCADLEIPTITKQDFPTALRLVVACSSYHTFKNPSSLGIVSFLQQGASLEVEKMVREVVRQQFISALSLSDLGQHCPNKFVGKYVLIFPAVGDRGVVAGARF